MSVIAVDLAAKFSAACWMSETRIPLQQWDSWQHPQHCFIEAITRAWATPEQPPLALVVEDLPARVPWMSVVRDVCRLQGRIVERMHIYHAVPAILFVQPAQWREHFPGLERGTGPAAVLPVAQSFGYQPPLDALLARAGKGERATARKAATDYAAAYLIGRWAIDMWQDTGTLDHPRTSRYENPA